MFFVQEIQHSLPPGVTTKQCSESHVQIVDSLGPIVDVWPTKQKFRHATARPGVKPTVGNLDALLKMVAKHRRPPAILGDPAGTSKPIQGSIVYRLTLIADFGSVDNATAAHREIVHLFERFPTRNFELKSPRLVSNNSTVKSPPDIKIDSPPLQSLVDNLSASVRQELKSQQQQLNASLKKRMDEFIAECQPPAKSADVEKAAEAAGCFEGSSPFVGGTSDDGIGRAPVGGAGGVSTPIAWTDATLAAHKTTASDHLIRKYQHLLALAAARLEHLGGTLNEAISVEIKRALP